MTATARRAGLLLLSGLVLSGCTLSPKPFTAEETAARVAEDLSKIYADQETITEAISLEEATARALKYNLDYRLKLMEKAVALDEASLSNYSLLPQITANAGYNYRSNDDGTENVEDGTPSITTEPVHNTADLELTWNVLDFGISYIRAKQQADMAMIVEERRRQVVHNIVKEVRQAFWRVVAAERNLPKLEDLLNRVRSALLSSEKLLDEGLGDPLAHLVYQRDLLDTLSQLEITQRDLLAARTNLAVLMNIHPNSDYTVTVADADMAAPLSFPLEVEQAEMIALHHRTELRGEAYQARVYAQESKIAVLRMLPGLSFSGGLHYDDDHFLINNSWKTGGISLAWNLLNVLKLPGALQLADSQVSLSEVRRLALSMAVISQVHVAGLRYRSAAKEYSLSQRRYEVEDRMRAQSWAARQAQQGGELAAIRDEVRSLQARLRRDLAFAGVQDAYGALFASMGADPLPNNLPSHELIDVKNALRQTFNDWEKGDVGPAI